MFRLLSIAVMDLILVTSAMSQDRGSDRLPAITLGRGVLVSSDAPTIPHAETFLALNPKEPAQMLATVDRI